MKQDTINTNLLRIFKEKIPRNENPANMLMDILCIGREAAYRRLRGEVPFSLGEAAIISEVLGVSLDNLVNEGAQNSRPFRLKMTNNITPVDSDYEEFEEFLQVLRSARKDSYTERGMSFNVLPQSLFLAYPFISRFYMFRVLHQWGKTAGIRTLSDVKISSRLAAIHKQYIEESSHVKNTYYIWDSQVFQHFVNDVKYYAGIRAITRQDVLQLRDALLQFVEDMEMLASKGYYKNGNKVQFYLSSVNLDSTYTYLQTDSFQYTHIKVFTQGGMVSLDEQTFDLTKNWIESLKRMATLISESGEMDRVRFFKRQREIINSLE